MPLREVQAETQAGSATGSAPAEQPTVLKSRCRRCLSPWLLELVTFIGGLAQAPRVAGLSDLVRLGAVLEQLSVPERRVYLQLYLLEQVGEYEAVAKAANSRWPLMHPPVRGLTGPRAREWSEWCVRRVIADARLRITNGMIAAGVWRFG